MQHSNKILNKTKNTLVNSQFIIKELKADPAKWCVHILNPVRVGRLDRFDANQCKTNPGLSWKITNHHRLKHDPVTATSTINYIYIYHNNADWHLNNGLFQLPQNSSNMTSLQPEMQLSLRNIYILVTYLRLDSAINMVFAIHKPGTIL